MSDGDFHERLENAKQESTLQLLFKAARLTNDHALSIARVRSGYTQLRAAHTSLLPHIDLNGTRLTVLSERLGITKQAVGQLVDELVDMGTLERRADPSDGRAKLIHFTVAGKRQLLEGLRLLGKIEQELVACVGERRARTLHQVLARWIEQLQKSK